MNPLTKVFDNLFEHGFELFGKYYSSYRGFVVDNKDPENYGRLKVVVPQVYGSKVMDYWAWPKGQFAGPGYGMQITPQVKEMVYVEFEGGNPRKPIWVYGHFGQTPSGEEEKPQTLINIKNFWFKTPGGHLIEFDDDTKEIRITDTNHNNITISGNTVKLNGNAEPSVLGTTLQTALEDICDAINNLSDSISILTVSTAFGPSGVPDNATDFQTISQGIISIKGNLSDIKSKLVELS